MLHSWPMSWQLLLLLLLLPSICLSRCGFTVQILPITDENTTGCAPPPSQHDDSEYGATRSPDGKSHSGGPFTIHVSPKIRVEELRMVIRVRGSRACSEAAGRLVDGASRRGAGRLPGAPCSPLKRQLPAMQDEGGILPALQKLSYAGKHLEDAQRTLEQ